MKLGHRRDKAAVPANAAQLAYIDLYTDGYGSGSFFVSRLASQVDASTGSVTITVPQVRAGSQYFIMREYPALSSAILY